MDGDLITSPRERTWVGPRLAVSLPMNAALPSAQAPPCPLVRWLVLAADQTQPRRENINSLPQWVPILATQSYSGRGRWDPPACG